MAEVRRQVPIRVSAEVYTTWSEAANSAGSSLNQYVIDAVQGRLAAPLGEFASTPSASRPVTTTGLTPVTVIAIFDAALAETPTLSGMRRWVDPDALREGIVAKLA